MTKLSTYIKPVAGGYRPPVETWELQDPNVQPDMALTWWVEQPQVVMPLMLTGAITVQDDRIGILDVHAWLFNTSQPRWEWRLNRDALSQVERHRRGQDLVIDIRLEGCPSVCELEGLTRSGWTGNVGQCEGLSRAAAHKADKPPRCY